MTRARVSIALLAVLLGLFAAGCGGGAGEVPAFAVAVVDGTEIPRSDLDDLVEQAKTSYKAREQEFPKVGTPEYQDLQRYYVAFLVQYTEYEHEAEKLGLEITEADIDKAIEDDVKGRFAGDRKKFDKALAEQGFDEESVRKLYRVSVLSRKIFDEVTKDVKVADTDALAYFTENKATQYPDSREVRHILISEKTKNDQVDYAKSKAEADRIYAQLQDGGDFAALARQFSDDPGSKSSGGKLTINRGQTVPEFEAEAFGLETGAISRPVKTQFGYHVIQPVKDVKTLPFDQVKDTIKATLLQQKRNEEMTQWVEDLQKRYEGKVSYAAGFAPPELPEPTVGLEPTETE